MRVKIDENMPVDAVRLLVGAGRDTSTVYDEHLVGAADRRVIEASRQKRRVLVSLDVDFPDIRRYPPEDWSGMVVLRPGEPGRDSVLALLATALPAFATEPVRQRLWIVEPNRIRIRRAAMAHELLNSRESPADSELRQLWVDELHCSARRS